MQVAFLDLERMQLLPQSGLENVGPAACLSGRLQLLRGQFGTMSQVRLFGNLSLSTSALWHE